jgi:hypothetical protein
MIQEVERFARRQPALFLGGAFTLGLIAARFLKSSSEVSHSMGYEADLRDGDPWAAQPYATAPMSSFDATTTGSTPGIASRPVPVTPLSDTPAVSVDADDEDLVPALGDRSAARSTDDA